jgi:hypothetical protein
LRHHAHLGQHRQERMQTRLESLLGIAHGHALLMAVLVQQARGIQIQGVAFVAAGQPIQAPPPQGTETTQIGPAEAKPAKNRESTGWLATRRMPKSSGTSGSRRR